MPRGFEYMKSTLGLLDLLHCTLTFVGMCTFGGYILWTLPEYNEIRLNHSRIVGDDGVNIVDAVVFWGFAIDVLGPVSFILYLGKFAFGSEMCRQLTGLFHFATGMFLLLLTFLCHARFCGLGFFCAGHAEVLQIPLILATCIGVLYVFSGFMTFTEVKEVEFDQRLPVVNRGLGGAQPGPPPVINRSRVGIV